MSLIEKIALKPCRFCGSVWVVVNRPANGSHLSVKCKQCNAHGPGHAGITEAEAIAAWNNRAALTAIMGEGDGVQEVDREAAQEFWNPDDFRTPYKDDIPSGAADDLDIVQAFARHRSTAAAAERARIVAWLRGYVEDVDMRGLYAEAGRLDLAADAIERGDV